MRVPSPTTGTTNRTRASATYARAAVPDLAPISRGIQQLGTSLEVQAAKARAQADQQEQFKALESLTEFNAGAKARSVDWQREAQPDDNTLASRVSADYDNYENEFIKSLKPEFQDEFRSRVASTRVAIKEQALTQQQANIGAYQKNSIGQQQNGALEEIQQNPDTLEGHKARIEELIDTSDLPETEKFALRQQNAMTLEKEGYKQTLKKKRIKDTTYMGELVSGTKQLASKYGLDPRDMLTVFSFETGGTFSTDQVGGAGNRHLGLIQFGKEEQAKYGVRKGMTPTEQLAAVEAFLDDRGFKPGMGLHQLYSTINTGSPNKLNASDAKNGGTWGTVADKVNHQMGGHARKAEQALAGEGGSGDPTDFGPHRANGVLALRGEYNVPDDLDTDPRFINVPFEDRNAIRTAAAAETAAFLVDQQKAQKAVRDAAVNDLYNGLFEGKFDRADIDEAMKTGLITDFDERKKAVGILEEREKEGLTQRKAAERLASGNMFDITDSEDKKSLNTLFGQAGTDAINQRDEAYVQQQLLPLASKAGALPSDAVGVLTSMSRSNDPRNMVFALQTLNALENLNSSVYAAQTTPALRHKADLYEALSGTVPEKQLHEMLADAPTSEMRNTREFYRKEAEALTQPSNPQAVKFEDQFDELEGEPSAPATVVAKQEWNTLFTENYSRVSGNRGAAVALTNKQYSRVWKKTQIDGADALMKYPPELYIPSLNGNFDWATAQIRGELGLVEGERVYLQSDATTAKEVAATQSGQQVQPSWLIFKQKINGELIPLMAPDGRSFMRQTFKPTTEDLAAQELSLRVKSKELELDNVRALMQTGPRGSVLGVPAEIIEREQAVRGEIEALKGKETEVKAKVENNYKFPSQKKADELEKQMFDLMDEQLLFDGPRKDWPRLKELFGIEKAYMQAKRDADKEKADAEKKASE